jgi:hypothetical protein
LPGVSSLVEEHRHRRFRVPFPEIANERAERHHTQTIETDVAVIPLTDMPRQNAFADAGCRRLSEGAWTGNAAITRVEQVTLDVPPSECVPYASDQAVIMDRSAQEHPESGAQQEQSRDSRALHAKPCQLLECHK